MNLKTALESGQLLFGCFISIAHPAAVEICAMQPFDLLCIDAEHSQMDRERIEELVRAGDLADKPMMVRVSDALPSCIFAALDSGAQAVLVPRVSTVREAGLIAAAGRYPPQGRRGIGPSRATRYGYNVAGYLSKANQNVLLAVQIETAEGLRNVDEIAAVEGIDMLFVGPFDLALSIDATGPSGEQKLHRAMGDIASSAAKYGKFAGIFRPDADDLRKWSAAGFRLFLIGSDAMFIGAAAAQLLEKTRIRDA